MEQIKKTLIIFMASAITMFGILGSVTAKAAVLTIPKINYVGVDHSPIVVGDTQRFIITSNYKGLVQYRAFLFDGNKWSELEKGTDFYGYYIPAGYSAPVDAKTPYVFPVTKPFKLGKYKLSVWVKRAGTKGINTKGYDTCYTTELNCVSRDDANIVYVSGDAKGETNGLTVKINGIENIGGIKGPYLYRLLIFNPTTGEWSKGSEEYTKTPSYTFNEAGTYVVIAHVNTVNSKTWAKGGYEASKTVVVTVKNKEIAKVLDTTVKAVNYDAKEFKVAFNAPVADTTKVEFTVKRGSTPLIMETTWNAVSTEATLTYEKNLPEDTYTIGVVNDVKDLGTSTIAVKKQKVAKIQILGDTLAVVPPTRHSTYDGGGIWPGRGYVSYKVFDQYGADITNNSLASKINWKSSIGKVRTEKGLLVISSPDDFDTKLLTRYNKTIITAIAPNSSAKLTKTLKVSSTKGALSDIKLNSLTKFDVEGSTPGNSVSYFFLDYTALDINGYETKSRELLFEGIDKITSSNPSLVVAGVVQDPTDSTKGVIEVRQVWHRYAIFTDTPIVLTAITKTGKSSSITITLKKDKAFDQLTP